MWMLKSKGKLFLDFGYEKNKLPVGDIVDRPRHREEEKTELKSNFIININTSKKVVEG